VLYFSHVQDRAAVADTICVQFFNAILYDPVMTLQFFEQLGVTQLVFQTWMASKSLMNTYASKLRFGL